MFARYDEVLLSDSKKNEIKVKSPELKAQIKLITRAASLRSTQLLFDDYLVLYQFRPTRDYCGNYVFFMEKYNFFAKKWPISPIFGVMSEKTGNLVTFIQIYYKGRSSPRPVGTSEGQEHLY